MTADLYLRVYAINDRQIHLMNQLLELEYERMMTVPVSLEKVHTSAKAAITDLQNSLVLMRKYQNVLRRKIVKGEL